jgi:iron complex outermembrane recepter protein
MLFADLAAFFRFTCALRYAAGWLVLAAVAVAQTPAPGAIEGRVFDTKRGEYLENARITIAGTKQEVLTDATGFFRLANVPPGTVTLTVFYTGRATQQEEVVVAPGKVAERDITFSEGGKNSGAGQVVKLEQFVVETSKEMDGAALAINEQRFARNIVNVVSADEFGTIADGSIGEFMKFLPGITSDYTGGDARRFSINGAPADNVPISMGGFDLASAAGAGTRRAVELDQISINNISRIEINRAPTPETSGSSLAGSVNFVPRSSFERNKPSYNYSVAWLMKDAEIALGRKTPGPGWGDETYKVHPSFDVSAVVPVTKNFGFTVSGGYSLQYTPQSNVATQWRGAHTTTNQPATATPTGTGSWFPDTTAENPYLGTFSWRDSGKNTSRESFATTVDWRFAPHDRLTFGFSYGMLREHFATRTQTFTINRVAPGDWGPTYTHGMASTFPTTGSAVNSGNIAISNNGRIRPGRTIAPSLRWLHEGPVWKSDAGVAYGNSRIHYQDIDKGFFNGMTVRRNNVQILFDDIFYLRPGRITVLDPAGQPVDPSRLDSYSVVSANSNRQRTYDTTRQAYGNLRRDFVVRDIPLALKVGVDLKEKVRDLRGPGGNLETYTYVGADGRASTTPFTQAGVPNDDSPLPFLDVPYSERIPDFGLPKQQQVDNGKLWQDYNANPSHWTRNANNDYIALTNFSRRAQERISSVFIRGDAALFNRRLKIVTGVRAEQTNVQAEGPLNDPTLAYQRDASGRVVRDAGGRPVLLVPTNAGLAYSELTRIERGTKADKEYLRLFPSLNASYNFTDGLIGRVAYSQSVGRPDFNQYAGGVSLPDIENINPNSRITVNNASIQAWQAETYMARLEYYFGNAGSLSVGGFIRDYKNFFENVVSLVTPDFLETYGLDEADYGGILVSTQFNNPNKVRQHGFEVDYKQALTFLPHWGRGVRFFANVSSQRAKGTDNLQDMNPFTANWGLSLTRSKFNLRINENYRGIQRRGLVTGRGIEAGTYNYRPKRLYIDITGEYYLNRRFGIFAALRNVGGATEDTKIYGPSTPAYAKFRQRDDYASLWTFGIKGTF